MSRLAPSRLLTALLALAALGVVSCFQDAGECLTCPPAKSGRIDVLVRQNGLIDSVYIRLDGGVQDTLRRNPRGDRRQVYEHLSAGDHEVILTRWSFIEGILISRTFTLHVRLARGESRTIVFHNEFPLIASGPARDEFRAQVPRRLEPIARRLG